MQKSLVFSLLFTVFVNTISAQKIFAIDSLIKRLTIVSDTAKVNLLIEIAEEYGFLDEHEKAKSSFLEAIRLAESINFMEGIIYSLNSLGCQNLWRGNFSSALKNHERALELAEKIKDKRRIANSLNFISVVYRKKDDYLKSLDFSLRSLKLFEEMDNKEGMAMAYTSTGHIYLRMENYLPSLSYHLKALKIYENIEDKKNVSISLGNIGRIYYYLHDYNKAMDYYSKALAILEKYGKKSDTFVLLIKIADIHKENKEYSKALEFYEKTLKIVESLGDRQINATIFLSIGSIYKEQNQYQKAQEYFLKGLDFAKEIDSKNDIKQAYYQLSGLSFLQKSYKNAYELHTLYSDTKDSLFKESSSKQIAEMQAKYDAEKKEHEIEQLKTEQVIQQFQSSRKQYTFYGFFALAVIIGTLLFREHKTRNRHQTIKLEQKLLRSQMNPHFIYNSLNAIQNFILKNKVKESAIYISNFAMLMRLILDNSRKEYISVRKELDTLELYLKLQQLRFVDEFDYFIEVDPEIDTEEMSLPPMLAQPFIENAIEHGILQKDVHGIIGVRFKMRNQFLTFEIEDNGIGREKAQELKQAHTSTAHISLATLITQERIQMLNKQNGEKIKFEIIDLKDENGDAAGTKVIFNIPIRI